MLLRGKEVELITTKGDVLLDGTEGFWLMSDDRGEIGSACHVYLCRTKLDGRPVGQACHPQDIEDARSYHDGRRRFRAYNPLFSLEGWRLVALVSEIRYLRDRPPPFRHVFDRPVRCYVSSSRPVTYKITLGEGCILNDHGFVEP